MTRETIEQRCERIVRQEVYVCLSSLVYTLSQGYGTIQSTIGNAKGNDTALVELVDQAFELASPVLDYEEAAQQAGWVVDGDMFVSHDAQTTAQASPLDATGWEELCREDEIEPYEWEVFEHWSISEWLGRKLEALGERVDFDFGGMVVWGRTTTGQGIAMDGVIRRIVESIDKEPASPRGWEFAETRADLSPPG